MAKADDLRAKIGLGGSPRERIYTASPHIPDHEMVRRIGSGSYGDVWLARNAVGTWRAVKVVYRAHFEDARPYEREFSGIQKYEPISRTNEGLVDVLQIGRNDAEGYFYYVMELADDADGASSPWSVVSGQKPEAYVAKTLSHELQRRGHLTVEECITLGLTLNLALGHLHRSGLIHRDVKPSNIIFVNGVPKLADIGLVTDLGEAQSFVGTEGFIPPEGPNSPQADLYALGKVLYEASMGKDRQEFPEPRSGLGLDAASRSLMELNAVLLRACAPKPGQRYKTAAEMNADLALLHSGKSVKDKHALERRLKITIRLTIAFGVILVLGIVPYYIAVRQWRSARAEATKNQHVVHFFKNMLSGVGPSVAKGRDRTMLKEILDKTAEKVGKELANEPEVEAELRMRLGEIYLDLGEHEQAKVMYEKALGLRRSFFGENHPDVAQSMSDLAHVLFEEGKTAQAEIMQRQALGTLVKALGNEHEDVAVMRNDLAILLHQQGKLAEAEAMHRAALELQRRLLGSKHREVATSLNNLAVVFAGQGKFSEAESSVREALAIQKELLGLDDLGTVHSLSTLGGILQQLGKITEAEAVSLEELTILRKLVGNEHPQVARALHNRGNLLFSLGKAAEAADAFCEALEMRQRLLGDDHPDVAVSMNGLAAALLQQGESREAETLLWKALALEKKNFGDAHPFVAWSFNSLAWVLREQSNLAAAEAMARAGLEIRERLLPPAHPDVTGSLETLTTILDDQGKRSESEALERQRLEKLRLQIPADDPKLAGAIALLTATLLAQEKFAEAEPLARECLQVREKRIPDDWATFNSRSQLGGCLLGLKKFTDAEPLLRSGYEGMKQREAKIPRMRRTRLKEALQRLVQLYTDTARRDQTIEWKQKLADFELADWERQTGSARQ